jgi:hypothetical protein
MITRTMCRFLTALSLMAVAGGAAHAACKDEVASALERQRHTSAFSMKTRMLSEQGLVNMTVDYVLPNRMRQVVSTTTEPKPVESILIGREGWTRVEGEDWQPMHPQVADAMAAHMQETLGDEQENGVGDFECLGKQSVGDQSYLAYQGENVEPEKPGAPPRPKPQDKPKDPGRAVRVIYVDQTTGLPMRSIYALANKLDKPIFASTYTYPADIKIEAPRVSAAPAEKK